jgi:hypothetical protein
MTVHKSQGMSMDAALVDLSRAFEYGQGYVALSRVRRLTGLYLLGLNARALEVHPEVAERDRVFKAAAEEAREAFGAMAPVELEALQKNFVRAMGGEWVEEGRVKEEAKRKKAARASRAAADTYAETLALVKERKPLADIAKARSFTPETIVRHIEVLVKDGRLAHAELAYLLPSAKVMDEIREALAEAAGEKLAPVFYKLKGRHSYEAIRLARLAQK